MEKTPCCNKQKIITIVKEYGSDPNYRVKNKYPWRCKECGYHIGNCKCDELSESAVLPCSVPDVIGNARSRGAIDFVAGVKVGENPFGEHDARHWGWMEGWASAGLEAVQA